MSHEFCRENYKSIMKEVRKKVDRATIKSAWGRVNKSFGKKHGEFHINKNDFYWQGQAHCVWDAKAKGWQAYLRSLEEDKMRISELAEELRGVTGASMDEAVVTQKAADSIEKMIDTHSMRNFMGAIAGICYEKADHVAMNWQDEKLAKVWERIASAIERIKIPSNL